MIATTNPAAWAYRLAPAVMLAALALGHMGEARAQDLFGKGSPLRNTPFDPRTIDQTARDVDQARLRQMSTSPRPGRDFTKLYVKNSTPSRGVESLEGRMLLSAAPTSLKSNSSVAALIRIERIGPGTIVGTPAVAHPVAVEVTPKSVAGPAVTLAGRPEAVSSFQYSAVTIRNSTAGTVNYSFRWGNGATTNFTLTRNQERVHFIRSLNQVATVAYDRSFSPGFQEQRYALAGRNIVRGGGFYLVEPTPSVGEGRLYTFRGVTNGVQLYS